VSTAHGLKFQEFKARLCASPQGAWSNQPVPLPGDPEGALAGLARALDARARG
jgi:hypothetical protein